jgi:membrane protein implicated in regulation of membrane protease activity
MANLWYIWVILAAIFMVAEVFTSGFVLLWFGVGALTAALVALSGVGGLPLQVIVFLAVSILLTVASRTILERFFRRSPGRELLTGIESLPGKVGVVVESSSGALKDGAVRVFGSTWRAFPADGEEALLEGDQVKVERVDGVSIYVRKIRNERTWRDEQ